MSSWIFENPNWKVTIEVKKECEPTEKKKLYKMIEEILGMLDSLKPKK